ncbi:MAG: TatD family hydrolase [Candidatus Wildermuthbacteria bacterium]|nr:TatD family hydrolase [Candidatus Wildermuthbacteria bacterium]
MIIDTHAHMNFGAFKEDGKEVLARTLKENIWVIMPGSQSSTSRRGVEIARQYPEGVYAAVGLHPAHLEKREMEKEEVEGSEAFETRGEEFERWIFP